MSSSGDAASRLITVSIWAGGVWAVLALGFGLVLTSQTIIFDGLYSLVTLALSLLSLGAARGVRKGPSERYPFGREGFEPMANIVRAVGLGGLCIFALSTSALVIADGGNEVDYLWGLLYAVLVAIGGGGVTLYLHRRQRRIGSDLVAGEVTKWLMDTATTGGLVVGFGVGLILQQTGHAQTARYVDPVVLILFSAVALALPLRMGIQAFRELVLASAPTPIVEDVRRRVRELERHHRFAESFARVSKVGGLLDVEVYFVVGSQTPVREVEAFDHVRRELEQTLDELGYDQWLTVSFTADPAFATEGILHPTDR